MLPFNTGDCLIDVTAWTSLTALHTLSKTFPALMSFRIVYYFVNLFGFAFVAFPTPKCDFCIVSSKKYFIIIFFLTLLFYVFLIHTVFSVIIDPVFIVIIDLPSLVYFCMNNAMTDLSIQIQVASLSDVILIML
jgi:hypothetical protein